MPPQRKRLSVRVAPREIRCGEGTSRVLYRRLSGHHAVHRREAEARAPGAVLLLEGGKVAVFRGTVKARRATPGERAGPVYRLAPGRALAVPTGLVLIRFAQGATARENSGAIERAGYEIASILEYAPNAAWVRAATGSIADSLRNLPALRSIPTAKRVEPQMLMESRRR
jgi:hypothetical protein